MLNEVIFYHETSSTLIVADAFYTGYCNGTPNHDNPPSPFTRIWFKMTKDHWSTAQLPIYRTSRVLTNGKPEILIKCLRSLVDEWKPKQMIGAHGDRVVQSTPGSSLIKAWTDGVGRKKTAHA